MAVAEGEVVWVAGGLSSCNIEIPIPGMDTFSISKDECLHSPFFRPIKGGGEGRKIEGESEMEREREIEGGEGEGYLRGGRWAYLCIMSLCKWCTDRTVEERLAMYSV